MKLLAQAVMATAGLPQAESARWRSPSRSGVVRSIGNDAVRPETALSPPTSRRGFWLAVVLIVACAPAQALTYLVGAGAVPSQCDFNSLQAAIDAAAANAGVDFIRVANDQAYTAMALSIGQQDLTITGGYATCTAALPPTAQPTGNTILSGAGGGAAPVVSITGSGVRVLASLQIRNGDNVQGNGSGCGGGIRFNGRGELVLRNTGIAQNQANFGGGICFAGTASPTALNIQSGTSINNNTATTGDGGGITLAGTARLFMLDDNTLIAFNTAMNGLGGGIHMVAPTVADIGSPGVGSLGVLYANQARRGGGLSVVASSAGDACARLYTTDALRPVRLLQNVASEAGGAIFLSSTFDETAVLRAYDFRIDGNTAPNGPAMFAQGGSNILGNQDGSDIHFNTSTNYAACDEALFPYGRVPCANPAVCNLIEENRAENTIGQPTNGNIVELRDGSGLSGIGVTMRANRGTRLVSWSDGGLGTLRLRTCALVDNVLTQEVFRSFSRNFFTLADCTIAANALGAGRVFRFDDDEGFVDLKHVLVAQPGSTTMSTANVSELYNKWVIASETASLSPDPTLLNAPARFVDPQGGDYQLRIGSRAVDFAPAGGLADVQTDLDNRPRDRDLGDDHANAEVRDIGGYERQPDAPWLMNGDFDTDLRLWSNLDPAHATWTDALNAPESTGGSLVFSIPVGSVGPTERRAALSQCFNVPAAGDYRVFGRALGAGFGGSQDFPLVRWRLRYGNDACLGAVDDEGERFFGLGTTVWQPLAQPLVIPVAAGAWTWNTTIELVLEAQQNTASPTASGLFARFDAIEIMRVPTTPKIFQDGFET